MNLIFTNHFPKQNIEIPLYYKVSSFTYTLGGLYIYKNKEELFQYLDFPWILYSYLLVNIGILSYLNDSYWAHLT